jgi:AcrR family transcriptional regulator
MLILHAKPACPMMEKTPNDVSTEEKIKAAARRIFTQKGYAATRTRDIAREAGINLSMLNYYFRSKEKLFHLVMLESFEYFVAGMKDELNDRSTSLEEKITIFARNYIDILSQQPDIYLFLMNEVRMNPALLSRISLSRFMRQSYFMEQLSAAMKKNKLYKKLDPVHMIMNLYSLTIFPFTTNQTLQQAGEGHALNFAELMEERKKWIPKWIMALLEMG